MDSIAVWQECARKNPRTAARRFQQRVDALPEAARTAGLAWTVNEDWLAECIAEGLAVSPSGALAGVPYALKDLFDVAGVPTRAGSSFLPEVRPTPTENGLLVNYLLRHGAVLAAKTHLVEFAYGLSGENRHYGDCPHPRVPGALAGGSSSGSAWAVGAGLVPWAVGTDTAGSLRVPAACVGLYAWRCAPNGWSRDGCFPLAPSFDTTGWLAGSAADLRQVNHALLRANSAAGHEPLVLDLTAFGVGGEPELMAAGQAVLRGLDAVTDEEALGYARAAFSEADRAYNILGSREAFNVHAAWLDDYRDRYDPVTWERIDRARHWSEDEVLWAATRQGEVRLAWAELFARYDAVALPITPQASPSSADMTADFRAQLLRLNTPASLAGLPALTVPLLLPDGRSGGLQFLFADSFAAPSMADALLAQLD